MNKDSEATRTFLAYRDRIELHDFLAYMRIVERLQISQTTRFAVWLLALVLASASIFALFLGVAKVEACFLLAIGGYFVTWPIHHPLYLRWHYRRSRSLMPESDVTADEHGVRAKSELADVSYPWTTVKLAVDSPDGVLLCNERRQPLMWFPQRAFHGGAKAEVLAVAARNGAKVIRFGGD